MNVLQFLRSVLPSFKRNELSEKIRQIRDELVSHTLPPFDSAVNDFKGKGFKSKPVVAFEQEMLKAVNVPHRGSWLEITHQVLKNLQGNFDYLDGLVEKNYSHDIVVSGITFKRAQFLQYIAVASFTVDYARRFLLYALACEANQVAKSLPEGRERPLPEIKWLTDNRMAFFRSLSVMAITEKDLSHMFEQIPDIVVSEDSAQTVAQTIGRHKVDPMNFNIIPIGANPFHFIGVRWANWQATKYQRAKEEKRALEFRLEQLRGQRADVNDPRLEKSIEYYEGEVDRLAARIAKMEE